MPRERQGRGPYATLPDNLLDDLPQSSAGELQSSTTTDLARSAVDIALTPAAPPIRETPAPGPSHSRWIPLWLLRQGTWPLVVAADTAALVGAALLLRPAVLLGVCFALVVLCAYAALGLYRSRLSLSVLDEFPPLLLGVLAATALTGVLAKMLDGFLDVQQMALFGALSLVGIVFARSVAFGLVRLLRRTKIAHPTLIIGAGRVGAHVATTLAAHPEHGLRPVGFVDPNPLLRFEAGEPPLLGDFVSLPQVLSRNRIGTVIIAFSSSREETLIDVIRACDRMHCEIFVVPRLFELHHVSRDMDYAWGIPLTRLRRGAHRAFTWQIKRMFDLVVSAFALLLLAIPMSLIALMVRIDGGPGVLFKQTRVGVDGRRFDLLKFRSLRPVDETESATNWNISNDSRMSKIGKFLRSTSLDELPQLFNILRGEMSLVGPRPERPHFVEQFRTLHPRYNARHRVPCGLTGWAQIHGLRGDTSIADRSRFDNYYVENWSLWLDVKIILRTMTSVFTRAGS